MVKAQNQLQDWLLTQAYGQQVLLQIQQQLQHLTGKQHYAQVLQLGLPQVRLLPRGTMCTAAFFGRSTRAHRGRF